MKTNNKLAQNPYCLDKLALTFGLDEQEQLLAERRLECLMKEKPNLLILENTKFKCVPCKIPGLMKHYTNTYKVTVGSGFGKFSLLISASPKRRSCHYLRIEFNPNKARKRGMQQIRSLLEFICGTNAASRLYDTCRTNRLDPCFDVKMDLGNTYPYCPGISFSKIFRDTDDFIQSFYIGQGNKVYRLYDKVAEILKRTGCDDYPGNLFRLELQLRGLGCSLKELDPAQFLEPLSKLEFFDDDFLDDECFDTSFLMDAEEFGLNRALADCHKSVRKSYLRRLRKYHKVECPFDLTEIIRKDFRKILHELDFGHLSNQS